jgi:hypothetical protein
VNPTTPSKECGWKPFAYRVPVLDPTRESKSLIFWLLDSGNSGRNKFMAADGASLSVQRVWSGRRVRRFGSSVPLSGRRLPAPSEEQMRGQPPSQGAVTMSLVVVTDQMKGTAGGPDLGCIRKDTYYEYANSQGGRWPRRMQRSSMSKFWIGPMSMSCHDHSLLFGSALLAADAVAAAEGEPTGNRGESASAKTTTTSAYRNLPLLQLLCPV